MAKVNVNKHDYNRVILTETLPYEVPITFSNEGVYFHLAGREGYASEFSDFFDKIFRVSGYTTPFNYRITKNSRSKRLLSIPHPSIQIEFSDFYKSYDSLITDLCGKSPVSLRSPSKVASRYYEKELVNYDTLKVDAVEVEEEAFESKAIVASSYFTYKKYNFLYKFYDSYESHRIEKKFDYLTRFDISKCFHNIYVPTLSWAVKDKEYAKKYSDSYSFEKTFQDLMINSNELESSGILVGPEFSRIFAEIILQSIDNSIIDRILCELGLVFDKDYTFRRYVDDYFLYTKDEKIPKNIFSIVCDELEKNKLFINESKSSFHEVPFITGLTIAKMDCKDLVDSMYSPFISDDRSSFVDASFVNFPRSPGSVANRFIKNIKRIVKTNNVSYESLTGRTLSEIRRHLFSVVRDQRVASAIEDGDHRAILRFILMSIEVSFFIYSMDIRVRTTYIITQMIVIINGLTDLGNIEFKDEISKKIYDETTLLLSKMADKGKANSIETLNLLIGLSTNRNDYPIAESTLYSLFNLEEKEVDGKTILCVKEGKDLGYFQIMVLSYFCKREKVNITQLLQSLVTSKLDSCAIPEKNTEIVCMILDSIRNPYFDEEFRKQLLSKFNLALGIEMSPVNEEHLYQYIAGKDWFFTWDEAGLESVLMKKELRSPY
ncbi:antiviral reverse transcriptase Drt3b [Neptuniibacter sp. PT8_73]|uniref:antiviral reverse transcriptase Drt3b n=1 Tax=Neptuniibacter sp. PT8_73 TaxID=3398206 RepID=UPI0039F5D95F